MTALDVPLSSIRAAFQGAIPSPIATVSADGVPNSTYLSVVWYIDEERVGISNQFLAKTTANLRTNPHVAMIVVDPTTMTEYELQATHLRSERSGEAFEAVRARIDAVAAESGMQDVFRLRSLELLRVDRCAPVRGRARFGARPIRSAEVLAPLDVFVRRLAECRDLGEATRIALESIEDLFDFRHSMLLVADDPETHLLTVATNGHVGGEVGAETPIDAGAVGVAASRRRQVRIGNVGRMELGAAVPRPSTEATDDNSGGGLPRAQSIVATPLLLHDRLIGVLYVASDEPGRFDADSGRLLEVLAGHLAVTVALLEAGGADPLPTSAPATDADPDRVSTTAVVAFHDHDGSVLIDGDYIIKGVPGRILFSMLGEHARSGREEFTNREIRLDPANGLPAGKDNLEARLLALRRRLSDRSDPIHLERIGRGRLRLTVDAELSLVHHDH